MMVNLELSPYDLAKARIIFQTELIPSYANPILRRDPDHDRLGLPA
jgi:hypothetical protein